LSTQTGYERVKRHYRDARVATTYESSRFLSPRGQKRNRLTLAAIGRAFDKATALGTPIRCCLDLPCGTGRLFPWLLQRQLHFVGADISHEMMRMAWTKIGAEIDAAIPFALMQCDGEHLPFKDRCFDAVFCIRFMFHVPREVRVRILREMARVSRRWLIVDFRHGCNFRWRVWQVCHGLGLVKHMGETWSRRSLRREAAEAELRLAGIFSPRRGLSLFSDKWIVLLERAGGES
jgi:SAM-dependent methyltransferase